MNEPVLRAFMGEDIPAKAFYEVCPGRWVGEKTWPSERIQLQTFFLEHGLVETSTRKYVIEHKSPQTLGLAAGEWCPYGTGGDGPEFPGNQQFDDGVSITFDSSPFDTSMQILGAPVANLVLAVDQPQAFVAVRLNDVKPDGTSTRVSYAVLNLCHRDSHETPTNLEPGRRYTVRVQLDDCAYSFLPGHRARVAVSTSYWPMIWPSPRPVTLKLFAGDSTIELPVRPTTDEPEVSAFGMPEEGPSMPVTQLEARPSRNIVSRDIATGRVDVISERGDGLYRIEEHGLAFARDTDERMSIVEGDPLSAETEMVVRSRMKRDDWSVDSHTVNRRC
jgi:predicted acyl esterase